MIFSLNKYNKCLLFIFALSIILRLSLTLINYQANDDHFDIIKIIKEEGRIPDKDDHEEGFQPKFFYLFNAAFLKLMPFDNKIINYKFCQFVNFITGVINLYIILLLLTKVIKNGKIILVSFSFIALNPRLIAINSQLTNDSFVILFSTMAIYFGYLFIDKKSYKLFIFMTLFTILAALSKGNGLIIFTCISIFFIYAVIFHKNDIHRRNYYIILLLTYLSINLMTIPFLGGYYYNYRKYGDPFIINMPKAQAPKFFCKKYDADYRVGVTSIYESYFTFRYQDIIKNPMITNDKYHYPLHRTSLWSQLYGRTFFAHFDNWPPAWQTENILVISLGRIILSLAILPAILFIIGLFGEISKLYKQKLSYPVDKTYSKNNSIFLLIIFFGYISFIISYTFIYRDFSTMKVIFIFPAILPMVKFFANGLEYIFDKLNNYKKITHALNITFVILWFSFVLEILILEGQLFVSLLPRLKILINA